MGCCVIPSLAAHKRDTITFGRRLNAFVERLFLVAIWRHLVKGVSQRKNDRTTPAMGLGLTDRRGSGSGCLAENCFLREKN